MPHDTGWSLLDEWHAAAAGLADCASITNARSCLVASLAARIGNLDGGAEVWRAAVDDALYLVGA